MRKGLEMAQDALWEAKEGVRSLAIRIAWKGQNWGLLGIPASHSGSKRQRNGMLLPILYYVH